VSEGRPEDSGRDEPARPSRRKFLLRGLGLVGAAGAAAVARTPVADAAETFRGMSFDRVERSAAVGPATGGAPLALGIRRVIWSAQVASPVFALTFDDGPDPEFTNDVLDILQQRGLKATFNMMGYNAEHHPELAKEVVARGHEVSNHTWTHRDLAYEDESNTYLQISRGRKLITDVTGQVPRYFRPPRGELTGSALRVAASLDHDVLLYTLFGDVAGVEKPDAVRAYVVDHLKPGYIVAFHDGIGRGTFDRKAPGSRDLAARRHAEIKALPSILDDALHRGLRPVTATELLEHEAKHSEL